MSTWYDPHVGDERRAQLLRIQRLPEEYQYLRQPARLYRMYHLDEVPEQRIANDLRWSDAYQNDPHAVDHIKTDAALLWTWALRWEQGYDPYRRAVQRRMK